jgi:hypothetical protein
MQSFTKTAWTDNALPSISAAQLNRIESGIFLASAPLVTVLPSTPVDGQECNYLADATNGVVWHLVYRSATGKWHYTGGPELYGYILTEESTTSGAFTDLTTPGPSLTAPLAGTYDLEWNFRGYNTASQNACVMSLNIAGATPVETDGADVYAFGASTGYIPTAISRRRLTLTAGAPVKAQYKYSGPIGGSTSYFMKRTLTMRPVVVG